MSSIYSPTLIQTSFFVSAHLQLLQDKNQDISNSKCCVIVMFLFEGDIFIISFIVTVSRQALLQFLLYFHLALFFQFSSSLHDTTVKVVWQLSTSYWGARLTAFHFSSPNASLICFSKLFDNTKYWFCSNLEGFWGKKIIQGSHWKDFEFQHFTPNRCASQLLSKNSGNGVGWIRYDHCGFLHCQSGCLPGVGPAWGAHHRHQWPEGVCMMTLQSPTYKYCTRWDKSSINYAITFLFLSVFTAEKSIRQVHLCHSETELCGHLLPAASGA